MSWMRRLRAFREGVLGLNRRNQRYVFRYNERHLFHLVDDKLTTKSRLAAHGIPVPRTYAVFRVPWDLRRLRRAVSALDEFVIKPARGSGGGGIVAITSRRDLWFMKGDGRELSVTDLEDHVADILGGAYSKNQRADEAILEYRIHPDPVVGRMSYKGVGDIRVLVFRGIPAFAMLRLPTRRSDGRANLHMGGIGVGIDMRTGRTSRAWGPRGEVRLHPDLEEPLVDVALPGWDAILEISARCYDAIGLGYLGADIVLDAELGPIVLELNARPGLSIQLANGMGLCSVLAPLEERWKPDLSVSERIALGREAYERAAELWV